MCAHITVVTHPPGVCSGLQQAVITQCSSDCPGCNADSVATVLASCTIDGVAQEPGVTFCVRGTPCSQLQHGVLARCLSNCANCQIDTTNVVLGDCVVDDGTRAVEVVTTTCSTGQACTDTQQAQLAQCVQSCDACDQVAIGASLGACTVDGHGAGVSMVQTGCSGDGQAPCGSAGAPSCETSCSQVQAAVFFECSSSCGDCDLEAVRSTLRGCALNDGRRAADTLDEACTGTPPPPPGAPLHCSSMHVVRAGGAARPGRAVL